VKREGVGPREKVQGGKEGKREDSQNANKILTRRKPVVERLKSSNVVEQRTKTIQAPGKKGFKDKSPKKEGNIWEAGEKITRKNNRKKNYSKTKKVEERENFVSEGCIQRITGRVIRKRRGGGLTEKKRGSELGYYEGEEVHDLIDS